ncbi:MAG: hypothetical protein ACKV2U_22225 [Bryobacteraceae bacterium]
MFVVPRSTNSSNSTDSRTSLTQSRSAETRRQRGTSPQSFALAADIGSGRASDGSTRRTASPKIVTAAPSVENLSPAAGPVAPGKAAAGGVGMQKLLDTLSALGMSTSGLNISYTEDTVGYPGGSYVNRMINVTSGGKTEQFSGELTERNPFVTAYEMQRYFGVTPNAGGANGSVRQG